MIGSLLILALFASAVPVWWIIIQRLMSRQPIIAFCPRQPVSWGLIHIIATLFLMFLLGSMAGSLLGQANLVDQAQGGDSSAPNVWLVGMSSLVTLVATFISVLIVLWRNQFDLLDIGWDAKTIREDVKLGCLAFFALGGPTLAIQFVFVALMKFESNHPLIEILQKNPWFFPVSAFAAVLVAPVCEEYLFRVLFQGWLEKVTSEDLDGTRLLMGDPPRPRFRTQPASGVIQESTNDQPLEADPAEVISPHLEADSSAHDGVLESVNDNPYSAPQLETQHQEAPRKSPTPLQAVVPITISALVFALMHFSHGPDWVALFFLALGLGYVFQRTHRILPCIVVHFLLNGFSLLLVVLHMLGSPR